MLEMGKVTFLSQTKHLRGTKLHKFYNHKRLFDVALHVKLELKHQHRTPKVPTCKMKKNYAKMIWTLLLLLLRRRRRRRHRRHRRRH
jgi:hypothetical protein